MRDATQRVALKHSVVDATAMKNSEISREDRGTSGRFQLDFHRKVMQKQ